MIPDIINGLFEGLGGFAILLSILDLHKKKRVAGVHWGHIMFYTSWGFWNLYYYWHLEQIVSWVGGVGVLLANLVYISLIFKYKEKS